jgi:HPt (histidine-containing phosphotransfer) domain-containing protein
MIEADAKSCNRVSAPPLAPAEPVIDLAHLARMTLGEKTLEAEVLALFDRQADILLERMRKAPRGAAGAFAHTLKGSARGIGAWRVAEAAERVECAASSCDAAHVADALDRLAAAIDEARATIAQLPAVA